MLKIEQRGPFEIMISWEADRSIRLNEFHDVIKPCESAHPDAVKYEGLHAGNAGYYRVVDRSMKEVVSYFEERGSKNPKKDAIADLAQQVSHYLDGYELHPTAHVYVGDIELYTSYVCATEFSYAYWKNESEAVKEIAATYINTDHLIARAIAEVDKLLDAVSETIAVKEGVSV